MTINDLPDLVREYFAAKKVFAEWQKAKRDGDIVCDDDRQCYDEARNRMLKAKQLIDLCIGGIA